MKNHLLLLTVLVMAALAVVSVNCGPKQTQAPAQPTTKAASEPPAASQTEAATSLPKLWDFWATWCPPCKELKPIVEALEKEYEGRVEVKSIDVDQNKELAAKYDVKAIPTLVFLDGAGNEVSRIVGLVPKDTLVGRFKAHGFIE
ncbi:thioredoxin [candidate division WOR-3 bacterium]|nr:thioredoxin [candidate division WOR-3 bacterium]